uniref:F-box/kelch-repeat protein OR23 n=1 Tax=Cannabis sativa TaxID=3483 RepID=A0A803PGR2_CANSA
MNQILVPSSSSLINQTLTLNLIPGLPNDIGALILSFISYSHHGRLKSICKSWKLFLSSKALISLRHSHGSRSLSHLLCIFSQDPSVASPYLFDLQNLAWCPLPPMPCNPHVYGLCNFTSVAIGPFLYVIGGSVFDTRSFPLDRPSPSSAAFRILVAGGGSRHKLFAAAGSRISSVEMYDVKRDEWVSLDGLPSFRAGCVGFFVEDGEENSEFWVVGGYGESRTISGMFPVDEYCRDAVVMEMKNGNDGKWREIGDVWKIGERIRLGKIVVVEDKDHRCSGVYMLDGIDILRYDMDSNRWQEESHVPKEERCTLSSIGFVALDGELLVITVKKAVESGENRRCLRQHKKGRSLYIQIYNPKRKTWRSLTTKSPFVNKLDFSNAVMCNIRM